MTLNKITIDNFYPANSSPRENIAITVPKAPHPIITTEPALNSFVLLADTIEKDLS